MVVPINKIVHGDCIEIMQSLPDNSIDCIVTDPPYGISFMGKKWDKALPPAAAFEQMLRVLKPGGLAFVMSSPRQDVLWRMMALLENTGFELKQSFISWIYKKGLPKAYTVGNGWRAITGLKPALECILMANKPRSEKTIKKNFSKWGTGAINVDACRIPFQPHEPNLRWDKGKWDKARTVTNDGKHIYGKYAGLRKDPHKLGRFPANLLVSDRAIDGDGEDSESRYFDLDVWAVGRGFCDTPKAGKRERGEGNIHLTVKPIKLMSYLIELGCPSDGVVLDPFVGSGTTCIAAKQLGKKYLGIELDKKYVEIARDRLRTSCQR